MKEKEISLDPKLIRLLQDQIEIEQLFIVDIETTGFSSDLNKIYLIGCLHYTQDHFKVTQWLCEKNEDEYELLFRFAKYMNDFKVALHYNGTTFDFPFIKKRLKLYRIPSCIDAIKEIDVYADIRPFHRFINIENLKLKTVEAFNGYQRRDIFDGKTLINTFNAYTKSPDPHLEEALLLHNEEDLLGLYQSLKLYESIHLFKAMRQKTILVKNLSISVNDHTLQLSLPFLTSFNSIIKNELYCLQIQDNMLTLMIPILEETLKYYLPNHKDYFYLPAEDQVVHQSVAKFVHKDHKTKATKENCYIKKRSKFIPLFNNFYTEIHTFKNHYKESLDYVELTEELILSQELSSQLFLDALSSL